MHREGTRGREYSGRANSLVACYLVASCAALVLVLDWFPLPYEIRSEWFLLSGLALVAEFLPVQLSRKGLRITFALPYVAGMAVAVGPSAAVVLELVVTIAVACSLISRRRRPTDPIWFAAHVSTAVLSACAGAAVLPIFTGEPALQALAFSSAYTLANLTLVCAPSYVFGKGRLSETFVASLRLGGQAFALYGLIAMAVAVLLREQLGVMVALTLLPVLALRGLVVMQDRAYEHYYDTITALTLMLQRAHPYTHGHLERVARVAEDVALRLGLSPGRARLVREAAVLHDIGKIAVDEEILDASRRLTGDEMDHVRRHSALGAEILAQAPQFADVSRWILHHHERPDGWGYPYGLPHDQIPIESQIIAVSDAYDAMTGGDSGEGRSYRATLTKGEALSELRECSGTQFDAAVVRAFHEVLV